MRLCFSSISDFNLAISDSSCWIFSRLTPSVDSSKKSVCVPVDVVVVRLSEVTDVTSSVSCSVLDSTESFKLHLALTTQRVEFSRSVGAFLILAEVLPHEKTDGTAPGVRRILPASVFLRSLSRKCLEQTLVTALTVKYCPSSRLLVWTHFCFNFLSVGNWKKETLLPSSR